MTNHEAALAASLERLAARYEALAAEARGADAADWVVRVDAVVTETAVESTRVRAAWATFGERPVAELRTSGRRLADALRTLLAQVDAAELELDRRRRALAPEPDATARRRHAAAAYGGTAHVRSSG